ncbi:hypothetical protein ACQKKX_03745 [Neorhizobium sp. NPDC001467]|uniref:hypothetical protein n=1 Tax=Neorhizobium sp. NPDC001467 TaxID=3390595 RepID=UPI003D065AA3
MMFFNKPAIAETATDDMFATGTFADGLLQLTEKELAEFARKDFSGASFLRDYGARRRVSECRIGQI